MRLWRKASCVLKDKYSIWVAKFSRRNPDLEAMIIKATSHDEQCMDYNNVQRVFQWVCSSPTLYLKPLLWSLSKRMEKTRSWIVALKGLMLIHGVFCCDLPSMQRMGRLPFDLSNFSDGHTNPEKAWGFNAFVRSYFAYLDQRSAFICSEIKRQNKPRKETEVSIMEELQNLQRLQNLIDMLLQIKPRHVNFMNGGLILEAMDCIIDELSEMYDKVCERVNRILVRIYNIGGKVEAGIGLKVVQKAAFQGDKLSLYFQFCRDIGVINASQCPKIERISEKDVYDLQRIISGREEKRLDGNNEEKGILVREYSASATISEQKVSSEKGLKTLITEKWEVFDDGTNTMIDVKGNYASNSNGTWAIATTTNPFEESYSLVPCHPLIHNHVLPDLISF